MVPGSSVNIPAGGGRASENPPTSNPATPHVPLHLGSEPRPRHTEQSGVGVVAFSHACPLGARCGEVDGRRRSDATELLCAAVAETAVDDLCDEYVTNRSTRNPADVAAQRSQPPRAGKAQLFVHNLLTRWTGIPASVTLPIFDQRTNIHPAFLVADQIIVDSPEAASPIKRFLAIDIGRASKTMLLSAFFDAASVVVPAGIAGLVEAERNDRQGPEVDAPVIDLTTCDCYPVHRFAHQQLDSVLQRLSVS